MNEKGFSLIEVMIAITVLAIGMLAVVTMQASSTGGNALAQTVTKATSYAVVQMETLVGLPYGDGNLNDVTGDGAVGMSRPYPQLDGDPNVLVDADFAGLAPDYSVTSADGDYTICWNVTVNEPLPNTKSIRIIVISTGRGTQKAVYFDFVKAF